MKVIMLTSMSGPDVQRNRGDEIEVSGKEGASLIKAGFAQPVRTSEQETSRKKKAQETTTVVSDAEARAETTDTDGADADPGVDITTAVVGEGGGAESGAEVDSAAGNVASE